MISGKQKYKKGDIVYLDGVESPNKRCYGIVVSASSTISIFWFLRKQVGKFVIRAYWGGRMKYKKGDVIHYDFAITNERYYGVVLKVYRTAQKEERAIVFWKRQFHWKCNKVLDHSIRELELPPRCVIVS
jgi:hypothetical protein